MLRRPSAATLPASSTPKPDRVDRQSTLAAMEQDTNERADETRSETTEASTATVDVVDEQLIEEISIDGMCGVY